MYYSLIFICITFPVLVFNHCTPAGHIEAHLRHPHCWVWLTASQLFGQLFAAQQAEELLSLWKGEGNDASNHPAARVFITNGLDKKVQSKEGSLCHASNDPISHFVAL